MVAVEQDTSKMCIALPWLPEYLDIIFDYEVVDNKIRVRRQEVLNALRWLVKYNVLYQEYNVKIDELKLDLVKGEDSVQLPMRKTTASSADDSFVDSDLGPAPDQTLSSELNSIENIDCEVSG
jgi:hypothetical protein